MSDRKHYIAVDLGGRRFESGRPLLKRVAIKEDCVFDILCNFIRTYSFTQRNKRRCSTMNGHLFPLSRQGTKCKARTDL
jgi:hypothetical protein